MTPFRNKKRKIQIWEKFHKNKLKKRTKVNSLLVKAKEKYMAFQFVHIDITEHCEIRKTVGYKLKPRTVLYRTVKSCSVPIQFVCCMWNVGCEVHIDCKALKICSVLIMVKSLFLQKFKQDSACGRVLECLSLCPNWLPTHSFPASECVPPPPGTKGGRGATLAWGWGGGGPIRIAGEKAVTLFTLWCCTVQQNK